MTHASNRRGVALILVLWMIVILGGIAAAVTAGSRSTTDVTANARSRTIARYAAESGIVAATTALQLAMDGAGDDLENVALPSTMPNTRWVRTRVSKWVMRVCVL